MRTAALIGGLTLALALGAGRPAGQDRVYRVDLTYQAPGHGPSPNFSPKGTQVPLADVPAGRALPADAVRPARAGVIKIGPDQASWMGILVTADADHPRDLCRVYLDRNRNGNFLDDGPALFATPTQNDKTKAWWSSFSRTELSIPYRATRASEPYMVTFWAVREGEQPPDVIRYSVSSWRAGTITVNGTQTLVAAMDGNNDAIFDKDDYWSVLEADAPDAAKAVLSYSEARPTNRLMFVKTGNREEVLEFRSFSPDGRSLTFAVVDRPTTKAADRAGDDPLATERGRARAATPFPWGHDLAAAQARARAAHRSVLIDFETTWCGPCKSMDDWIWTDAEVAALLNAGFVGVKLDGDVEKALVGRFKVAGYPTMIVLDSGGVETRRMVGYQSSKEILAQLGAPR